MEIINLTENPDIVNLLLSQNKGDKVKGCVRARGKCPVCSKNFTYFQKMGYACPDCKTMPTRFYVDLWHNGEHIPIYSDEKGQALDTYDRANRLLEHINYLMAHHKFDPAKFKKSDARKFWVSTLLDGFLDDKIEGIAPSYQKDYRRMVSIAKEFFSSNSEIDIRELRKKDIIGYKKYLENNRGYKNKTLKNTLDLFKTFLNHVKDLEIIVTVPPFPDIDTGQHNFKWLSQEDQISLFDLVSEHDKPIIAFLMLHGCRPSEARALKCRDVDVKNGCITISATFSGRTYREKRKGRKAKPVVIPIHPETHDYVSDRVKNNLPDAWLFVNRHGRNYSENALRRIWDNVRKDAGIDKSLRLYDATRHSFASRLVNSGTSIFKVSRLLGHSSVKMTEKYAHGEIESLKADMGNISLRKTASVHHIQTTSERKIEQK
jgi:integrase